MLDFYFLIFLTHFGFPSLRTSTENKIGLFGTIGMGESGMTSQALGGLLKNYGPSKRQKLFIYPPELGFGDDNRQ